MSAERVGALLRETMEAPPATLAANGAKVTTERAEHYCVPIKLKRLYRDRKLGSPFAKGEEDVSRYVMPVNLFLYPLIPIVRQARNIQSSSHLALRKPMELF